MRSNLAQFKSEISQGIFGHVKTFALYRANHLQNLLIGEAPDTQTEQVFFDLPKGKPSAKISNDAIVVKFPLKDDVSAFWRLDDGVGRARLPEFMPQLQIISTLIFNTQSSAEQSASAAGSGDHGLDQNLLYALQNVNQVSRANRLNYVLSIFGEGFDAPHMALVSFIGNRLKRFSVFNQSLRGAISNAKPAINGILKNRNRSQVTVLHQEDEENVLHFEAISKMLQIKDMAILLPQGDNGVAVFCDERLLKNEQAQEMLAIANLVAMPKPSFWDRMISTKHIWSKVLALGVLAVMLWPGKMTVQGVIVTTPATSQVLSLGQQAQLDEVYFDAGDWVEAGDVLAKFESKSLEDQLVQLQLQNSLESLNAQDSLGQNEYGKVVLAEQRQKIVRSEERV